MADKLEITVTQQGNSYRVSAELIETMVLPREIFLYENNGTASLGSFIGVCSLADLSQRQAWTGSMLPTFGNRYVRHDIALVNVPDANLAATTAANILASVRRLKSTYAEPPETTTIYDI